MTASEILTRYISFFEKRGHKRIPNAPLVPMNDPTTLFTSSGMQPLVPYLLGEKHPLGNRLVNVQNCLRAQDIDEIGDNRHTTFFRMIGNWSLGDYFKEAQLNWFFEFLTDKTNGLGLEPHKLYVTVFKGDDNFRIIQNGKYQSLPKDAEATSIWTEIAKKVNLNPDERVFLYGTEKNWWSRSGTPDKMPIGEPGGPDSEVFYDFGKELQIHENSPYKEQKCHLNCDCGRFMEIGNSVFMEFKKIDHETFEELPHKNVDFGGGLERLVAATEDQFDVFQTSLLRPIIASIETITDQQYPEHKRHMRIIADHLVASVFIINNGVKPSNKEQGYILRRLIRRAFDSINSIRGIENMQVPTRRIAEAIITQYSKTDADLKTNAEKIIETILKETNDYRFTIVKAQQFIRKKYKSVGDELMGTVEIAADDAFLLYTTHGLSPTQIESLGYTFDRQKFAEKMEQHQNLSRSGAAQKFAGGLADHQERTIMGHTGTHLLQQALRDVLGEHVHQTGSNITTQRLRFDFTHNAKLTDEEIERVEKIVNQKIHENLPVYYLMLPLKKAKALGAIGLFDEKYQEQVKVYCMGGTKEHPQEAYSKEFCGGPHVDFTSQVKSFTIKKQENIGNKQRRIYAVVG